MSTLIPRTLLFKVLFCVAINTGIGLVFVLLRWSPFFPSMVYAQAIGLSIFTLMTLGIRLFAPDAANHTHRPLLIMPFAVIGGLFFGYGAGDLILGYGQLRSIIGSPNSMGAILLFSLLVSGALTYFFTSRDRLSRAREEVAKSAAAAEAAQRHAAEAQLKLLETQLEPHMLFNTLANLRVLIGIDAPRAQDMLDHLIAYLRATLSASRASSHTLEAEFTRLQDYLALMQVRMGPRLRFNLNLPDQLKNHTLPPLLLQAIVENSIKHGLEPKIEGGEITVSAEQQGANFMLCVHDSGVGLPAVPTAPTTGGGFGLNQVRERLLAAYGTQATIEMSAAPAGGTTVNITFPLPT